MKTYITAAILLMLVFVSCKKKEETKTDPPAAATDTTPPVITLNGKSNDSTFLGNAYVDLGASVMDNTDGNISSSLKITGTVNTGSVGAYLLHYDAKDAAGNQAVSLTRTVNVVNTAAFLTGNYNVACSCTAAIAGQSPTITTDNYTASVQVSVLSNNSFTVSALKIGPVNVVPVTSLNGNVMNVSYISSAYPRNTSSGSLSASKTSFTIQSESYDQMYPSRTHSCKNVYSK